MERGSLGQGLYFGMFVGSRVYQVIVKSCFCERSVMVLIDKIDCFGSIFDVVLERADR